MNNGLKQTARNTQVHNSNKVEKLNSTTAKITSGASGNTSAWKEPKNGLKKRAIKCAVVAGLAIVLVGAYAFGRNSGQNVVMADSFIDKVAGTATNKIDDALTDEIAQKVVEEQIKGIVTKDFVSQAIKEQLGDSVPAAVQDQMTELITEAVNSKVTEVLSSQQNFLSDGQREEVQTMISTAIKEKLGNKDVSSITQEDLDALKAEIENGMNDSIKQLLSSSTIQFSPQTLELLKKQLNLTDVVNNALDSSSTVLKQSDMQTIKDSIVQQLQTSVKTPVKGKDYLTSAEVMTIEKNAADKATASITGDITGVQSSLTSLTGSVNSVKQNVDNLTEQMNALNNKQSDSLNQANNDLSNKIDANKDATNKTIADNKAAANKADAELSSKIDANKDETDKAISDNKAASDKADAEMSSEIAANKDATDKAIADLTAKTNASVNNINENITTIYSGIDQINQNAADLAGQVCIKNSFLRRITAKRGSIDRAEVVDTSNMTIAQFVGVLSANEVEYTTAINQLAYSLSQVQAIIGENFTYLSEKCASLKGLLDLNKDGIATFQDALLQESKNRQQAIQDATTPIYGDISDIRQKLNEYENAATNYTNSQTEENKKALEDAQAALEETLNRYKGELDTLSGTVDGLDSDTKDKITDLSDLIDQAKSALSDSDLALDEKIGNLNTTISQMTDKTNLLVTNLKNAINAEIQAREEAIEKTQEELNGTISETRNSLNDSISGAKRELSSTIVQEIKTVNDKLEQYNEAQTEYTKEKTKENADALATAKEELLQANTNLKTELRKSITDLDNQTKQQINSITETIGDLSATDGSLPDGPDISTKLKNLYDKLKQEAETREKNDEAEASKISSEILGATKDLGNKINTNSSSIASNRSDLDYVTERVKNLENSAKRKDQWATGIVLSTEMASVLSTETASSDKIVGRTVDDENQGITWRIDESNVGITNFSDTCDITIQYASGTPDIVCSYVQGNEYGGYLDVSVSKDFYSLCSGDITIQSIHVESAQ